MKKNKRDVIVKLKADRRKFKHVPDPEGIRKPGDRRDSRPGAVKKSSKTTVGYTPGQRYEAGFPVKVIARGKRGRSVFSGRCVDVSQSGILISLESGLRAGSGKKKAGGKRAAEARRYEDALPCLQTARRIRLVFRIPPGALPEGMETRVKTGARFVRETDTAGVPGFAFEFRQQLTEYTKRRKDRAALMISSAMLFVSTLIIMFMRTESLIYFRFFKLLYFYSILAAIFLLTRYLFGALYRPVPVDPDYMPGVSIIVPCFNEEKWIEKTILCCLDQDYPVDKLELIIVNDSSTDQSKLMIFRTLAGLAGEADRFKVHERVKYLEPKSMRGKRNALALGTRYATHDLVVFVDSDSFLAHDAIRHLVQPMKNPKVGGVTGRTDVANTYTNAVTKMQAVRYYIAFRIMKAAESYFDAVTCLSGPLACYRKSIVLENMKAWLEQKFMGQRATFGDDRSLTNFVLRKHRTLYQDTAICSTIVPNTHRSLLSQQMRWKRSWLRETMLASRFIWRKEPFMALFFYIGLITPALAPVIVVYNLVYVPLVYHVFPLAFLTGLLLLSSMMSFTQLFFRKSSLWFYGFIFCFYYVFVLLWQMPVAWFTFWKSTWGTRMTPSDVLASERKKRRNGKDTGWREERDMSL